MPEGMDWEMFEYNFSKEIRLHKGGEIIPIKSPGIICITQHKPEDLNEDYFELIEFPIVEHTAEIIYEGNLKMD